MGNFLSFPAIEKDRIQGENERLIYSITAMQGWRIDMEDSHTAMLELDEGKTDSNAFFAVFDGHGGREVSNFAGTNLQKRLVSEESYKAQDYQTALKKAFLGTDQDIIAADIMTSGCAAVAVIVTSDNKLYVANAGDSRCVLSVKGEVKALSFDHKPEDPKEKARIIAAGGYVEHFRVNGDLALSRGLGDLRFKKNDKLGPEAQSVTADPDITCHDISEDDEFFVLACDGIWDCLSSQEVVDFVRFHVSEGKELYEVGELLCDYCLAPDADLDGPNIGTDNMSVVIVAITHGRKKEEWSSWVAERVKSNYGYKTPSKFPPLYSESRMRRFKMTLERYTNHVNKT